MKRGDAVSGSAVQGHKCHLRNLKRDPWIQIVAELPGGRQPGLGENPAERAACLQASRFADDLDAPGEHLRVSGDGQMVRPRSGSQKRRVESKVRSPITRFGPMASPRRSTKI